MCTGRVVGDNACRSALHAAVLVLDPYVVVGRIAQAFIAILAEGWRGVAVDYV